MRPKRRSCLKLSITVLSILCLAICTTSAGELSDWVILSNSKAVKQHKLTGNGESRTLVGRVGTVDEQMPCRVSGSHEGDSYQLILRKHAGQTARLQVQEAYPPDSSGTRYVYRVYANDEQVYVRDYSALMFSRVSYFIDLDSPALTKTDKVTVKFENGREGSPFRLSAIWLYSDFDGYYKTSKLAVPFYLTPLIGNKSGAELDKEFQYLKNNIHPRPGSDVKLGSMDEHYYMNRDADATRKQFESLLSCAKKYDMPLEIAFVAWWAGTPMWFPDGKGGKFSDPEYQQICWSKSDNYDEGEPLKKLLGDKWDIKYGFTAPNVWSNTPWLTMNSATLNSARHRMIGEHLDILSSVVKDPANKDTAKYLLAIDMENEPRYWDYHCPDGKYPVKRENLVGDFNPHTEADAAKDGVKLDPADGLDYKERLWLHNNVARYQQETYNAHEKALKRLSIPFVGSASDTLWHEVYSHAFTDPGHPMQEVTNYHPVLEWNRLRGCRAGLEGVAAPCAAYLDVTREWGRWAQINYEENNGIGTERHLRELRSCYVYGARFYTFYNWQSINDQGNWTRYVQRFCQDEPRSCLNETAADTSASYVKSSCHQFALDQPQAWPTMNDIRVTLDTPGNYALTVYDGEDKAHILGYRYKLVNAVGPVSFDLPNCISIDDHKRVYCVLARSDKKEFGMLSNPNGKPVASMYMNAARERAQSLLICWRADAESLISELNRSGNRKMNKAEGLFAKGDYRRAYEEAVRQENTAL